MQEMTFFFSASDKLFSLTPSKGRTDKNTTCAQEKNILLHVILKQILSLCESERKKLISTDPQLQKSSNEICLGMVSPQLT